jgi:8-oxo-dGTP diphosphatase
VCGTAPVITHDLYHDESLVGSAWDVSRRAVRAVVLRGDSILTVHSEVNGDYKLPGGGVADGEADTEALVREVREECGYDVVAVGARFAVVREYDRAQRPGESVFMMESHYYFATVAPVAGEQALDPYEERLRFRPDWVSASDALQANRALLVAGGPVPRWTQRETWVLRALLECAPATGRV